MLDENKVQGVLNEDEDCDIKIAGPVSQKAPDDGELAAKEWEQQKNNGNIEKAYILGKALADILFSTEDILSAHCCKKYAANPVVRSNALVLFAFTVDTVLEQGCPNSVTAQTALNHFHEQVRGKSPETYAAIVESGAFSLYLLCSRDEYSSTFSCIGNAFADACDLEGDHAVKKLGDVLYKTYFELCSAQLRQTGFAS